MSLKFSSLDEHGLCVALPWGSNRPEWLLRRHPCRSPSWTELLSVYLSVSLPPVRVSQPRVGVFADCPSPASCVCLSVDVERPCFGRMDFFVQGSEGTMHSLVFTCEARHPHLSRVWVASLPASLNLSLGIFVSTELVSGQLSWGFPCFWGYHSLGQ